MNSQEHNGNTYKTVRIAVLAQIRGTVAPVYANVLVISYTRTGNSIIVCFQSISEKLILRSSTEIKSGYSIQLLTQPKQMGIRISMNAYSPGKMGICTRILAYEAMLRHYTKESSVDKRNEFD